MSGRSILKSFQWILALGYWLVSILPTYATQGQGVLKWGGDAESGAPYVFHDPTNYQVILGYEVDIVNEVARRMGYKADFIQNEWDSLMPGLDRKLYDVIVDGFAIREEIKGKIDFSIPYYISSFQLVTKVTNTTIDNLDNCQGRIVGTLKNSEAYKYLADVGGISIRVYEDEVNAYLDLKHDRIEAVFMDLPIAIFYAGKSKELKFVGQPVARLAYAMVVRKGDTGLLDRINHALETMRQDGSLRRILDRWNLWNAYTAEYLQDFSSTTQQPTAYLNYIASRKNFSDDGPHEVWLTRYLRFMPLLAQAAFKTLQISVLSMLIAMVLGLLLAVGCVYGPRWVKLSLLAYIETLRGTPLLIQLLFIFYALPNLGINFSPLWAGVIGLGLNYAAFEAENYRAGLVSVPKGQMEAARALGMTRYQALRYVVVPQAVQIVIPPITNDFISVIKDSSLVSAITIVELTKTYTQLATTYYDYFGIGIMVAGVYLVLGLPFICLARLGEKRMAAAEAKRTKP